MAEMIQPLTSLPLTVVPTAAPTPTTAPAAAEPGDLVVLTADQLRLQAAALRAQGQAEMTQAVRLEREAETQEFEAVKHQRQADVKTFEAKKAEREAAAAAEEAARAAQEEAQAQEEARQARWEAEAKEALAAQQEHEAQLLKTEGECLMASQDVEDFNQGVFLLSLADSGFDSARSLRDEALHLNSNVQASLDLARDKHAQATQKTEQARQDKASAAQDHDDAAHEVQLSGRAKEAAEALKLSADERRQVAERLLSQADVQSELAGLGEGGFLLK